MLATVVEGDQKAHFSIATTLRCWGRHYWTTLPLIHTLYCWVLSKEALSTIFKVFGMTWPGIEPRSPGPLANTLPIWQMSLKKLLFTIWRTSLNKRFSLKLLEGNRLHPTPEETTSKFFCLFLLFFFFFFFKSFSQLNF